MECCMSSKIPFMDLCRLCEKINSVPKQKKAEIFKKYMNYYRDYAAKLQLDSNFYPVLRLLVPQFDRERGAYGIKEHTLAKIYIRILGLSKEGHDASKLLNFRAPKTAGEHSGDFAEVAYWVLKNRCPDTGSLNVWQVNEHLDNIASKNADNDPRGVDAELVAMLLALSAMEQKWLIRMILKDMKLGMGGNRILSIYHPDAVELYDCTSSLAKVCETLKNPNVRLHEIEVSMFSPFRPMLAERCDVRFVEESMRKCQFYYVETKHDGERFQLHMENGIFKYFSRNGYEYTDTYAGILTPHIEKLLSKDVKSVILDGEMMVWNKKFNCFVTKGMDFDVKKLKDGGVLRPCLCVFDILWLNGTVLTNKPLTERLAKLQNVFTPETGILMHTERKQVTSGEEVVQELNQAIDDRLEGIILKEPESVYKPNARKGGWYKIKPEEAIFAEATCESEITFLKIFNLDLSFIDNFRFTHDFTTDKLIPKYTDGVMDQVDLIIMGGYYGHGRRKGYISHFLVGAAVPPQTEGDDPDVFYSVTRVGSGYSMDELAELLQKLQPHWQRVKPGPCPQHLFWTKEKPDLWIPPSKSYILQIKATEIVPSNAFKYGYALRFPRVEKIRYDKSWNQCTTITELEKLRMEAEGKLYSRHVELGIQSETLSLRKKARSNKAAAELGEQFQGINASEVDNVSAILNGKQFCVVSGNEEFSKKNVEKTVLEHGGSIVQNPGSQTFCVLAGEVTQRVRNMVQTAHYNIIHINWLMRCKTSGTLLPWSPADVINATEELEIKMHAKYDKYGDSFTCPATKESLKYSLKKVEEKGYDRVSMETMADLDIELFSGPSPHAVFRLCRAYVDRYRKLSDPSSETEDDVELELLEHDMVFYGGAVTSEINDNTTHVIIHSEYKGRLLDIQKLNHSRAAKFYIVSQKWVQESISQRRRLYELDFTP